MAKKKKNSGTYSKDHVVVMLEGLESQFKNFGDGQKDLTRKLEELSVKFDNLADGFDKFDIRLNNVEGKVSDISIRLMVVETKVDGLKRDVKDSYGSIADYISKVEDEIKTMKKEAKKLKSGLTKKFDLERVKKFEVRLVELEKKIAIKRS